MPASGNADTLARNLFRAGDQLADLEEVNQRAGELVLDRASVPRRSGALSASLRVASTMGEATVSSSLPYVYVARPSLRDSAQANAGAVLDLYAAHAVDSIADNL